MYFALTRDVVLALGQYSSEISKEAREERRLWCFRPEIIYCFPCCELQIFGRRTVIARLHAVNSLWRSSKEREFLFAALPVSLQSALEKGGPLPRANYFIREKVCLKLLQELYIDWIEDEIDLGTFRRPSMAIRRRNDELPLLAGRMIDRAGFIKNGHRLSEFALRRRQTFILTTGKFNRCFELYEIFENSFQEWLLKWQAALLARTVASDTTYASLPFSPRSFEFSALLYPRIKILFRPVFEPTFLSSDDISA